MKRALAGLLVLILMAGSMPIGAQQGSMSIEEAPATAPWWPDPDLNEAQFREGWNLRIPLSITDDNGRFEGAPVQVHLDLARSLTEAGWPHRNNVPASFMAYPESVRLVEYTTDWQEIRQPTNEWYLPASSCAPDTPEASCPPFKMFTTWLEPEQERYDKQQRGDFHGQRNPVITLEWLLPRQLPAGHTHHYFVYFDIEHNAGGDQEHRKEAITFTDGQMEPMDGLYWIGAGTTHYGFHPEDTTAETLVVIGQQPNTSGRIYTTTEQGNTFAQTASFCLLCGDSGSTTFSHSFGLNKNINFKVESDQPVTVMAHRLSQANSRVDILSAPEFVPSREGGMLGWNFDIPHVASACQAIRPLVSTQDQPDTCGIEVDQADQMYDAVTPYTLRDGSDDSEDPVLVQMMQSSSGPLQRSQVPTTLGGPVGTFFHAFTVPPQASSCTGQADKSGFWASSWREDARLSIADLNGFWHQNEEVPFAQWGNFDELAPVTGNPCPWQTSNFHNVFSLQQPEHAPIQVLAGGGKNTNIDVSQNSPFGGMHGMEFQLHGPFVIYHYYPSTEVELTFLPDGTRDAYDETNPGSPMRYTERPGPGGSMQEIRADDFTLLSADKPVSVFPLGEPTNYARFLSGKPDFLVPEIHPGQYRGYLFEVVPQGGFDPVFMTTQPGKSVQATFRVNNLALWNGEALDDDIRLSATVEEVRPQWAGSGSIGTRFADFNMEFNGSAQEQSNRLTVDLPDDVPSNTQIDIRVRAESTGNPQMVQDFFVVLLVQQTFDVEMWWGEPSSSGGPKDHPQRIQEGQEIPLEFVIRNDGSGTDSFDIRLPQPPGDGWDARITDRTGQSLSRVDLESGEQVGAILHLRAPLTAQLPAVTIPVTAVSATAPAQASNLIRLSASLALEEDFELIPERLSRSIAPGATERFNVTVHNTGEDALDIEIGLDAELPQGWGVAFAGNAQPRFSLMPDQQITLALDLSAPEVAAADDFVSFLVRAEAQSEGTEARDAVSLSAIVERSHLLEIEPVEEVTLRPGEVTSLDVTLTNLGNAPDDVRIEPAALPGGWRLGGLNDTKTVSPGETVNLTVEIQPPAHEPPGSIDLVLQARSGGPAFPFTVSTVVDTVHALAWEEVPTTLTQPGATPEAALRLNNMGNVPERVMVQALEALWDVRLGTSGVSIPPGSARTVLIEWDVPTNEPEGDRTIEVSARTESGVTDAVTLPVRVEETRLELEEAVLTSAPRAPGSVGTVIAMLHNPGAVPMKQAEARLMGEGEAGGDEIVVDRVSFASIGPDATVVAPLRWVAGEDPRVDRIAWGKTVDGTFLEMGTTPIPEGPEEDLTERQGIPLPHVLVIIMVVFGSVWLKRRKG